MCVHVKFAFKVILGGDSAAIGVDGGRVLGDSTAIGVDGCRVLGDSTAIGVDGGRVADGTRNKCIIQGNFFTRPGKYREIGF